MNITYIYSLITRQLVGIIGMSNNHFVYYADNDLLKLSIEVILSKNNIIGQYGILDGTIYYELTNWHNKNFLVGLNYLLPWPFYLAQVEYININNDFQKIKQLYDNIKQEEKDKQMIDTVKSLRGDYVETVKEKSS